MIVKKVSDLEGIEAGNLSNWCDRNNGVFDINKKGFLRSDQDAFGVCSGCANFRFAKSEFSIEFCECSRFDKPLHTRKAITECNEFSEKGRLSLYEMKEIAYLIDLEEKDRVGV